MKLYIVLNMSNSALNGNVQRNSFSPSRRYDLLQAIAEFEQYLITILNNEVVRNNGIKWWIAVYITFKRLTQDGSVQRTNAVFLSSTRSLFVGDNHERDIAAAFNEIYIKQEEFIELGSAWTLESVDQFCVNTVRFTPLRVGWFISLPKEIKRRHVVNIKSFDNKCIVWAILAALYPAKSNCQRLNNYRKYESKIRLDGVRFPTPIEDIEKIERQNHLSIHVFIYENKELLPYRIAKTKQQRHINLLLLKQSHWQTVPSTDSSYKQVKQLRQFTHYCWIRNFHCLMKELNDRTNTNYLYCVRYCFSCLQRFSKESVLKEHERFCVQFRSQKTQFPAKENRYLQFTAYHKQLTVPFVIYADFECFTRPCDSSADSTESDSSDNECHRQFTKYQRHIPSGFCYYVVCTDSRYSRGPVLYSRRDYSSDENDDDDDDGKSEPRNYIRSRIVVQFFDSLIEEEKRIRDILSKRVPLLDCEEAETALGLEENCYVCDKKLNNDRVRDHCHLTGKFRGIAHNSCNLKLRWSKRKPFSKYGFRIPVFFHNLRGYDAHILIQEFGRHKKRRLSCIANNSERFITLSTGILSFVDSFQFMPSSLEKLVQNLANDSAEKFKHLQMRCNHLTTKQQSLLLRKGVFPYDYFNNPDKLNEQCLPSREQFYSKLSMSGISDEDYSHAQEVWNEFNCKTFGDYHDIYLALDVLLLADVFENFRSMSLETYRLDPAHYFTAPGLAWDAMLRW